MSATTPTHVAVIGLWAQDVPATAHFYHQVIGLDLLPHHADERPHFKIGGTYLTILKGEPRPAQNSVPERFPLLALAVPDLDSAVENLQARQVELPWGIKQGTDSRWVMFHDPAGNLIELVEFI